MYYSVFNSEIGDILLVGDERGLQQVQFFNKSEVSGSWSLDDAFFADVKEQLSEYLNGKRKEFDLKLNISGTDFQKQVWSVMSKIPYGKTLSYQQVAEKINNPKAVRAVGGACNKNKIMIILPCHRIVGSNGSLAGFAGGLNVKDQLLKLET